MWQLYLALYAFNLVVLHVHLVAHVQGHAFQISEDAADMSQVPVHLDLPIIVSHPEIERNNVWVLACVWPAARMTDDSYYITWHHVTQLPLLTSTLH